MQTRFKNPFKRTVKKTKTLSSVPLESQEQITLIKWWNVFCVTKRIHEKCLFAIPNGGTRNAVEAKHLKAEGVRAGIPDLMLAVPYGPFHGLFIEMKRVKKGRISNEQKEMLEVFAKQGYKTVVCFGFEAAKTAIENYLTLFACK